MRLVILYGSQTGTAQDVAEQIWRESKSYGCTGPVLPLDEFPLEKLQTETLIVFVVATTGQGNEPENMHAFWRFLLRRSLPKDLLAHLNYACLGLGDSSYTQFNFAAKRLNKRLQQLGAKELQALGLCDDQHEQGLFAVSLPWIAALFEKFAQNWAVNRSLVNKPTFKWHVTKTSIAHAQPLTNENAAVLAFKVLENKRTTALDHFQDVRVLSFDFPHVANWSPGDVLQVRPCNSAQSVAAFFEILSEHNLPFNAQTCLQFEVAHKEMPLPATYANPMTLEELAKNVWDLSAQPRQRFFELLSINCQNELELEKLQELSTSVGLEDYISYVQRPRRTVLETLGDFPYACQALTLSVLCELFSHIQARSYSIASAVSSGKLDILVAVVNYRTKLVAARLGLCTNWLKSLEVDDEIPGLIKSGTFLLPAHNATPLIMVGPGTGIAPFRSIVQARLVENATGRLVIYFGCRKRGKDYHFREDFEAWQHMPKMDIFVAFSRDQEDKVYVQHLIKQETELLKQLIIEQKAVVLVAGSSNNMPKAVKEAFTQVLDNDQQLIEQLIKNKRYQEETWS